MRKDGLNELVKEILDSSKEIDLRYDGGVKMLYCKMAARLTGKSEGVYEEASRKFLRDNIGWHEDNRYDFKLHPDAMNKIINGSYHMPILGFCDNY